LYEHKSSKQRHCYSGNSCVGISYRCSNYKWNENPWWDNKGQYPEALFGVCSHLACSFC